MAQELVDHFISLRAPPGLAKLGGSEYEDHIRHSVDVLRKFRIQELADTKATGNILDRLDPTLDTLPCLFILRARIQNLPKSSTYSDELRRDAPLWTAVVFFLAHCDPVEIRFTGQEWLSLYDTVESSIQYESANGSSTPVVEHLVAALLRLDPSSSVLTQKHLSLVHYGLAGNCSSQLLPILYKSISHIPRKNTLNHENFKTASSDCPPRLYLYQIPGLINRAITLSMIQEYSILAAMNLIALQRWQMASYYLESVLVTPCNQGANGYMLEAYKKWTLVSLLAHGRAKDLPNSLNGSTKRTLKAMGRPYDTLSDVFGKTSHLRILAEIQDGHQIWAEDGNVGLVQQVLCEHQRRLVAKLSAIYTALPVTTVAARINMSEPATANYLKALIQRKKLNATLGKQQEPSGPLILRFLDSVADGGDWKSESQMRDELVKQTSRIKDLADDIQAADFSLSLHKTYTDQTRRWRSKEQGSGDGEPMDLTYNQPPEYEYEDEDVMGTK